jgi:hypothetical protein
VSNDTIAKWREEFLAKVKEEFEQDFKPEKNKHGGYIHWHDINAFNGYSVRVIKEHEEQRLKNEKALEALEELLYAQLDNGQYDKAVKTIKSALE